MNIIINQEKMYELLKKDANENLNLMIEKMFFKNIALSKIIKTYIEEGTQAKEAKTTLRMYLAMFKNIIYSENKYVKHLYELENSSLDPFKVDAKSLYGLFYPNGTFDIVIKGPKKDGIGYTSASTYKNENFLSDLDKISVKNICFNDLCKDKYFSHESLSEIVEVTNIILSYYPNFINKIYANNETIKELRK